MFNGSKKILDPVTRYNDIRETSRPRGMRMRCARENGGIIDAHRATISSRRSSKAPTLPPDARKGARRTSGRQRHTNTPSTWHYWSLVLTEFNRNPGMQRSDACVYRQAERARLPTDSTHRVLRVEDSPVPARIVGPAAMPQAGREEYPCAGAHAHAENVRVRLALKPTQRRFSGRAVR
eukprot:scaffold13621_cov135-Isochrysis_galbana.AAC.4